MTHNSSRHASRVQANNLRDGSSHFVRQAASMAGELDVLIGEAAASLGYQSLKEEQKRAVKASV